MTDNLSQITAQALADLQIELLRMLSNGDLLPQQLKLFLSLSKEEREKLLPLYAFATSEITKEQSRWFVSLTPQKREQLLLIMPSQKEEESVTLEEVAMDAVGAREEAGEVIEDEKIAEVNTKAKLTPLIMKDTSVLRLISGSEKLIIKAFDFSETKKEGTDIFEAFGFESCKKLQSNRIPDQPRPKLAVCVYELSYDATFSEIFGSVGVGLTRLCFTREQIRNFCLKHSAWLDTDGLPMFFLFRDDGSYFVARILLDEDGMKILEEELSCQTIWSASRPRRVVLPDLNSLEL